MLIVAATCSASITGANYALTMARLEQELTAPSLKLATLIMENARLSQLFALLTTIALTPLTTAKSQMVIQRVSAPTAPLPLNAAISATVLQKQ